MKAAKLAFGTFIALWVVFTLGPLYWTIATSLKMPADTALNPPEFFFSPSVRNYKTVLIGGPGGFYSIEQEGFWKSAMNSVIVALCVSLIAVSLASLMSFYLARRRQSPKRLLMWMLSFRMMPPIAIIIPYYIMFAHIGLVDSLASLIFINIVINAPLAVWLICPYMVGISSRYDEMAQVDGFRIWAVFWKIFLPLSKPGIVAAALIVFIFTWNEFLFALVLTGFRAKTLTILATGFITQRGIIWGQLTATAMLVTLPVLVLAVLARRYFGSGITFGLKRTA